LGWVCKALIVRDWALLWVISVGFEIMELTFQHMLPNFNECWWDSWILDVALCNFIGMWAGMKVSEEGEVLRFRLCLFGFESHACRCPYWPVAVALFAHAWVMLIGIASHTSLCDLERSASP
jgi:hypothetical protein